MKGLSQLELLLSFTVSNSLHYHQSLPHTTSSPTPPLPHLTPPHPLPLWPASLRHALGCDGAQLPDQTGPAGTEQCSNCRTQTVMEVGREGGRENRQGEVGREARKEKERTVDIGNKPVQSAECKLENHCRTHHSTAFRGWSEVAFCSMHR